MAARILFFENDPQFARLVRERLAARGAAVEVVDDGNTGLERATAQRPDLILLTIELPQMNGFLVCKKLKKNPETQGIPVVILSSEATEEIFEQHRKLRTRAEEYLRKPIDPETLVERIAAIVPLGAAEALDLSEEMEIPFEDVEEIEASAAPAVEDAEPVDDEIDAFAESAFDALVMGDDDGADATTVGTMSPELQRTLAAQSPGALASVEDVAPRKPTSLPPPPASLPPPPASLPPPPPKQESSHEGAAVVAADMEELERLRADLEKARQLADEAGTALDRQKDQVARLEKEAAELRARAAKGGGISSREFLDLREALNSKDKELLDLRDQVGARDKQLLDLRDKNLQLERGRADFEDKILELERARTDLDEQLTAARSDKDAASKRADDLKGRLERTEDKAKKLEAELDAERRGRAADVERAANERDEKVAAAERDRDEQVVAITKERDEKVAALELERDAKVAEAERERDERVTAAEAERDAKVAELQALVAAAEQDRDERTAAAARERDARIAEAEEAMALAARSHEEALAAQKAEHQRATEDRKSVV